MASRGRRIRRPQPIKRATKWHGGVLTVSTPGDTVVDFAVIYDRTVASDNIPGTCLKVIVGGYIENVDAAQADLSVGVGVQVINIDESEAYSIPDPLSTDTDIYRQSWLWREHFNFGASGNTNNYYHRFSPMVEINSRRKIGPSESLCLIVRGNRTGDLRRFLWARALIAT